MVLAAVDRRQFLGSELNQNDVIEHLNQYLKYDGLQIVQQGLHAVIVHLNEGDVEVEHPFAGSEDVTHVFIVEQIEKCDRKLGERDFDGAITNARSLVEAVLTDIEKKYNDAPPAYDGNLPRLFRRVQRLLNLSPGQEGLSDNLRQILSGLTSIVNGLASLRNTMTDSHVITYRPTEHHARLAVNAAKTICHFLFDTQLYQESRASE